jgi:arabinoxylan arabinofuranohydrolase
MNAQSGIETETCSEGGMDVTSISSGDWIKVRGVDFGAAGAKTFSARVASPAAGGAIELRLGSATGTLVGTCNVPSTGGAGSIPGSGGRTGSSTGTGGTLGFDGGVDARDAATVGGAGGAPGGSGGSQSLAGGGGSGGVSSAGGSSTPTHDDTASGCSCHIGKAGQAASTLLVVGLWAAAFGFGRSRAGRKR